MSVTGRMPDLQVCGLVLAAASTGAPRADQLARRLAGALVGAGAVLPGGLCLTDLPADPVCRGSRRWRLAWPGTPDAPRAPWQDMLADVCMSLDLVIAAASDANSPPALHEEPLATGIDLCIELTSPLVLPCGRQAFDLRALYTLLRARARSLDHRSGRALMRTLQAEADGMDEHRDGPRLFTHLARHFPPQPVLVPEDDGLSKAGSPAAWGLGRHGHWRGALFVRRPGPALLAALVQLQPLCGLAVARRARQAGVASEGMYRLRWQTSPWLDQALLHRRRLLTQARQLCLSQDSPTLTDEHGRLLGPAEATDRLLRQARDAQWTWEPNVLHLVPRPGRDPRPIEVLSPLQSLWQRHLLRILGPLWDPLFESISYGFRSGLGAQAAANAVRDALGSGYTHVLRTDIARCFDTVPHEPLLAAIDAVLPSADALLRRSLAACIQHPYTLNMDLRRRHLGLAQGAPLSPLLLNLYLTPLDRSLSALPVFAVRYADDLLVLARSREQAQQALEAIRRELDRLQLKLSAEKTVLHHVQQGFTFLGQRFDPNCLDPAVDGEPAQRKPLVVSWPWLQLGVNGASLEARREGRLLGRWPLRRLSAVVLLSPANLSTVLIERCHAQGVTVGMTLRSGRQHLVMPPMGRHQYDLAHQHALWHAAAPASQRLAIAQGLVDAKLHNTALVVAQRAPRAALRTQLQEVRRQLATAADLATLRGHEGHAARLTFRWLNDQIHPGVRSHFQSARRARGAPDRLNSLLNLGYYFLAARLRVWVRMQSLNPYLAWLHDADDPYETLVYDLMSHSAPLSTAWCCG